MDPLLLEQIIGLQGPLSGEKVQRVSSVSGGCIHNAWKLELNSGKTFFAKTNCPEFYEILKFESIGLETLRLYSDCSLLHIPEPLHLMKLESSAILLMPWIDISVGDETNLGKGLAFVHKSSSSKQDKLFGWETDGFIGSGPQPAGFLENWGECFVNLRLTPQLKIAQKWGLNIEKHSKLLEKLIDFLNDHNPSPSIVHGDLWKGNAGTSLDGKGVIFDPAIWWADREVDLAMTKLFGGFSNKFFESYEEILPLNKTSLNRIDIYNLYHLLNHANLFGGSYKNQCLNILQRLEILLLK